MCVGYHPISTLVDSRYLVMLHVEILTISDLQCEL